MAMKAASAIIELPADSPRKTMPPVFQTAKITRTILNIHASLSLREKQTEYAAESGSSGDIAFELNPVLPPENSELASKIISEKSDAVCMLA